MNNDVEQLIDFEITSVKTIKPDNYVFEIHVAVKSQTHQPTYLQLVFGEEGDIQGPRNTHAQGITCPKKHQSNLTFFKNYNL